jgi:hypothetical protein
VIRAASPESANLSGEDKVAADYLTTETHYRSLAGRIVSALTQGTNLALVTGDPPPDRELLAQALRNIAEARYTITPVTSGFPLAIEELLRAGSAVAGLSAGRRVMSAPEAPEMAPALFVMDGLDGDRNPRLQMISEAVGHGLPSGVAGVMLARSELLSRLQEPSLEFLIEPHTAQFRFDEIGGDEGIEFLRHQIASRRREEGREEEGGIPTGVLRGVAAMGGLVALGVGGFLVLQHIEVSKEPSARPAVSSSNLDAGAPPSGPVAPTSPPVSASAPPRTPAPPQPIDPEWKSANPEAQSAPVLLPSRTEIAALVNRGDDFLKTGDLASARLFYERAVDAGDAAAALRLGATFDLGFLARTGIRGASGDPAKASTWYKRAHDLGDAAAAERLKSLEQQSPQARESPAH